MDVEHIGQPVVVEQPKLVRSKYTIEQMVASDYCMEAERFKAICTLEKLREKHVYRHQRGFMQALGDFGRKYMPWVVKVRMRY